MQTPEETEETSAPRGRQVTYRASRSALLAAIVGGLTFVVVIEFLVIISFVGQRLWRDERLFHSWPFTLPLVLWLVLLVAVLALVLRTLTARFRAGAESFTLRGLLRRREEHRWEEVARVVAIEKIARAAPVSEDGIAERESYDGLYLRGADGGILARLPGSLFGRGAQETAIARSVENGAELDRIAHITPQDLHARMPGAQPIEELHPRLMLLAIVLFYLAHYALTFFVWGL